MPSRRLMNPVTGEVVFATIPDLKLGGILFAESPVILQAGKHHGPNRGFGAAHIWAEHSKEMARQGLSSEAEVPHYVLAMLRQGTPLFFEGASLRQQRLLAVRSGLGTAVLEFRDQRGEAIWSIVTAFSGTRTHGTRVGTVR